MSVSKSGSVKVETSKLLAVAEKLSLTVVRRAGWLLVYDKTPTRRLLVHTSFKGFTNCIELVGFEDPICMRHPNPPAKTMTGNTLLNCNTTPGEILRDFWTIASGLASMSASSEPVAQEEVILSTPVAEPTPASDPDFDAIMAAAS